MPSISKFSVDVKNLIAYFKVTQIGRIALVALDYTGIVLIEEDSSSAFQKNAIFLATKKSLRLDGVWESRIVLE